MADSKGMLTKVNDQMLRRQDETFRFSHACPTAHSPYFAHIDFSRKRRGRRRGIDKVPVDVNRKRESVFSVIFKTR